MGHIGQVDALVGFVHDDRGRLAPEVKFSLWSEVWSTLSWPSLNLKMSPF